MYESLTNILGSESIILNEPMKKHTTFRIGGNADVLVMPKSEKELISVLEICAQYGVNYYIMGNGSNLLVKDGGYRGVIIKLCRNYSDVSVEGGVINAESGALLSTVANVAMKNCLTGMEFASGIPGTIGGAVCMNAGAYGGEMKDIITSVRVLKDGVITEMSIEEAEMGYRSSKIMRDGMIVLSCSIRLEKGETEKIKAEMQRLNRLRNEKQPVELPSAGSTFKRPEGYFAAKLIDESGLRGYSVGGAQVSQKHCGFVVNNKNATAKEVLRLIENVEKTVLEKFGVELEPEIRIIGED